MLYLVEASLSLNSPERRAFYSFEMLWNINDGCIHVSKTSRYRFDVLADVFLFEVNLQERVFDLL